MISQLIVLLALGFASAASPVVVRDNLVKLPIARRLTFDLASNATLLEVDQARAKAIKNLLKPPPGQSDPTTAAATLNVPVTNAAQIYTAAVRSHNYQFGTSLMIPKVQVGSPPTTCWSPL